jgi:hypothetical protein
VIGLPHPEQNDLSATSDSFRVLRVEVSVKVNASVGTRVNGRFADPDSC